VNARAGEPDVDRLEALDDADAILGQQMEESGCVGAGPRHGRWF
jgi:hypothetical protein